MGNSFGILSRKQTDKKKEPTKNTVVYNVKTEQKKTYPVAIPVSSSYTSQNKPVEPNYVTDPAYFYLPQNIYNPNTYSQSSNDNDIDNKHKHHNTTTNLHTKTHDDDNSHHTFNNAHSYTPSFSHNSHNTTSHDYSSGWSGGGHHTTSHDHSSSWGGGDGGGGGGDGGGW